MPPSCKNLIACCTFGMERFCNPTCTRTLYFLAASIILRPSKMLWLAGFSTYTCLPAWQAQIVPSACQWLGVANETALISLSSKTLRISHSVAGFTPHFSVMVLTDAGQTFSSASQIVFKNTSRVSFSRHQLL